MLAVDNYSKGKLFADNVQHVSYWSLQGTMMDGVGTAYHSGAPDVIPDF